MTEHADAATTSSAADQARLRKERREAKLKAGGADRLNKITGIGGRVVGDGEQASRAAANDALPPAPSVAAQSPAADPEEIDISQHLHDPSVSGLSEAAQLRQMMLGPQHALGGRTPSMPNDDDNDAMMKMMMAQMLGGAGGPQSSPFAASPAHQQQQQQQQQQQTPYQIIWRLVHALVSIGLGLQLTLLTPFSGTEADRQRSSGVDEHHKRVFLWSFATAELVLLTTRLFLDQSRPRPSGGLVWTAVGFVPEPFKSYVGVALRYGQIFTTVRADLLTCIFVLGVASWFRTL